jgi:hypothetical protein
MDKQGAGLWVRGFPTERSPPRERREVNPRRRRTMRMKRIAELVTILMIREGVLSFLAAAEAGLGLWLGLRVYSQEE